MNPKLIATLACLAALAPVATARATERYTEQSDGVFEARGVRVVEVANSRGDVDVTPSPDGRIHVTAIKTCRGNTRADAERHAREITVEAGIRGDRCVIVVHYPRRTDIKVNLWDVLAGRGDSDDWKPRHEVQLRVQVPAALPLSAESVSGDLGVRGLSGRQNLRTTSGDVLVEAAGGVIDAQTVSGDVQARGAGRATLHTTSGDVTAAFAGPLEAHSTSGDIDVPSATDSLVLGSTSGDISVEHSPRAVTASTASGEIQVTSAAGVVSLGSSSGGIAVGLVAPFRGANLSTSSGDLSVDLAPGLDATLELNTTSGDIESDAPVVLMSHGRQFLNAKYGRGGTPLKARTASGDLHVTSGGR